MAEGGGYKERLGYIVSALTIVVSIGSLYCSVTQTRLSRQGFELNLYTAVSGLEKQLADVHALLADRQKGYNLSEILERIAQLQKQIADQQARFSEQKGERELADLHQRLGDVQRDLARLQQNVESKDKEIESLRGKVAQLEQARPPSRLFTSEAAKLLHTPPTSPTASSPLAAGLGLKTLPSSSMDFGLGLTGKKPFEIATSPIKLATPKPEPDSSLPAGVAALIGDLWDVFKKHPAASIYFGIALLVILGKLFGGK